ncbi:hypothetical protein BJ508DRAFT_411539 [Ascobolus immersus RN42]|uniref:Uncharacterized protein n=1 Tax=Ascobolus immersus RN42 TaxID=1160509 RepID=A0A3N4IIE5_ASCIM|nr:hypothetical protein BJ508DRAFT_411539 [Ascobolus immersus RN42]
MSEQDAIIDAPSKGEDIETVPTGGTVGGSQLSAVQLLDEASGKEPSNDRGDSDASEEDDALALVQENDASDLSKKMDEEDPDRASGAFAEEADSEYDWDEDPDYRTLDIRTDERYLHDKETLYPYIIGKRVWPHPERLSQHFKDTIREFYISLPQDGELSAWEHFNYNYKFITSSEDATNLYSCLQILHDSDLFPDPLRAVIEEYLEVYIQQVYPYLQRMYEAHKERVLGDRNGTWFVAKWYIQPLLVLADYGYSEFYYDGFRGLPERWKAGLVRPQQFFILETVLRAVMRFITAWVKNDIPTPSQLQKHVDRRDYTVYQYSAILAFFSDSSRFRSERLELLLVRYLTEESENNAVDGSGGSGHVSFVLGKKRKSKARSTRGSRGSRAHRAAPVTQTEKKWYISSSTAFDMTRRYSILKPIPKTQTAP